MFRIKGKSHYSNPNKPDNKSKYNKGKYGVRVESPEVTHISKSLDMTADEIIFQFSKPFTDENGNELVTIGCKNSKFAIPMWDMDGNKIEPVGLSNGTNIEVAFDIKDGQNGEYLVAVGIKVLEEIKDFNPFED